MRHTVQSRPSGYILGLLAECSSSGHVVVVGLAKLVGNLAVRILAMNHNLARWAARSLAVAEEGGDAGHGM